MTAAKLEERISAWMGGLLSDKESAEMARLVARDDQAARIHRRLLAVDALAREVFDAPMREAPPEHILETIRSGGGAEAVPLRPRPWRRPLAPVALAASLALAVGLGVMFWGAEEPGLPALGPVAQGGALQAALDAAPSGAPAAQVTVTASFLDAAGRPCREFDLRAEGGAEVAAMGLACRDAAGWTLEAVAEAPEGGRPETGFATATGVADPVAAALDRVGAGPVLTPEEERALIETGWR